MANGREWSEKELATLRSIWKSKLTVKESMHLLPGRSLFAIKSAAAVHKLPRKKYGFISWVQPTVIATLQKTAGLTTSEICATTGCCEAQVRIILKRLNSAPKKKVFVPSWCRSGTHWVQRWELGSSEDAPKPGRQDPDERRRLDRGRRHRSAKGFNPFAVAAGLVAAPSAPAGRMFTQSMSIREDEEVMA